MIDLDAWRVFVAVATAGSLTAAARRLGRSVPTVSKQIGSLEAHLETPLFHRTSRRLTLTVAGEASLARVREHVAGLEAAGDVMRERDGALVGRIRMTAPISFSKLYLSAPLTEFMVLWPGVLIDLHLSDHRVDLVAEGFDLSIRLGILPDSSLRARTLCKIRMPVVAAPSYLEAAGLPDHPRGLADHMTIALTQTCDPEVWTLHHPRHGAHRVRVTPRFAVDNGELARDAAVAGLGLVVLPEFLVHDDIRTGRLVEVLGPWSVEPINLNIVTSPSPLRTRRVAGLIEHLAAALVEQPWHTSRSGSGL